MAHAPILIYGGTGAIGSAIARRLAAAGRRVHLVARDPDALAALARETGATTTAGDVTDPALFERATADAAGDGALAGLAYAVGTIRLKPFHRLTAAEIEEDFALNALGAARAVQAALPGLRKADGGASVLLFSTVAVDQGFPAHASIAMAKGAVAALARTLAAELAPHVRVNAIAPSLTLGGMGNDVAATDSMKKAIADLHPAGRLGTGEDVAGVAEVLLTEAGTWITGQTIGVDGGRSTLKAR